MAAGAAAAGTLRGALVGDHCATGTEGPSVGTKEGLRVGGTNWRF